MPDHGSRTCWAGLKSCATEEIDTTEQTDAAVELVVVEIGRELRGFDGDQVLLVAHRADAGAVVPDDRPDAEEGEELTPADTAAMGMETPPPAAEEPMMDDMDGMTDEATDDTLLTEGDTIVM